MRIPIAALMVAVALAVTACGQDSGRLTPSTEQNASVNDINPQLTERIKDGGTLHQAVTPDSAHLTFNGGAGKILTDQKLRTALMAAVDRQVMADAVIGHVTPHPPLLDNHFYAIGTMSYVDNPGGLRFDQAKAKAELDADGWRMSGQYRVKDGKELDLTFLAPNSRPSNDIGQLLQ